MISVSRVKISLGRRNALIGKVKVLNVCINDMLHTDLNSLKRRFIGTKEIAYINKPAEIIVIDRIDKCLYPVALLAVKAVIFNRGFDALGLCVFRNGLAALRKHRKILFKACL